MPAFNAEAYIKDSIESIINQSYQDFELIIINDGSTDDTKKIINSFNDSRIRLYSSEINMGIVYSLNKAISMAKGEYLARMDSDDIANHDRLLLQLDYLKSNGLDICGTSISTFGSKMKKIYYPKTPEDVSFFSIFGSPVAHPTVFGYTKLFKKFLYNNVPAEDFDLWSRLLLEGFKIGNMENPLISYRVHSNQITRDLTKIIESSILISSRYIESYISNDSVRIELQKYKCFMKGNYERDEIYSFANEIILIAKEHQVSQAIQCRVINIMFSRSRTYNIFTLISYIKAIKASGVNLFRFIDLRLSFLFIFSIKKNSKIVFFLMRILKKI